MEKKVLVVEDDLISQKVLVHTLQRFGCVVTGASCGEEALSKAKADHPGLIFMDMKLPDMSGLNVIEKLREQKGLQDVPVVAITVSDLLADRNAALQAGCKDFITKPADPAKLKSILDTMFPA